MLHIYAFVTFDNCNFKTHNCFFQLEDTRTTDRKQTFLGYIVEVVQKKFPDLQDFSEELYLDGATTGELSISRQYVCQCIVVRARSF